MAKAKELPDLKKYSKEDLIWIINRMCAFDGDWSLKEALRMLKYDKDMKRIDEADRIAKQSHTLRQKYIDLLMPFEGKRISEIPVEILEEASEAMKNAQNLDKKWCKLMGVECP